MAATGDEAAAMDSISRVPAPPTDLNLSTEPDQRKDAGGTENQAPPPKRSSNNSELHL